MKKYQNKNISNNGVNHYTIEMKDFHYPYLSKIFYNKNISESEIAQKEIKRLVNKGFYPYRKSVKIIDEDKKYLVVARLEKVGKKKANLLIKYAKD